MNQDLRSVIGMTFIGGAQEPISGDAPEPRGNAVSTHCFVDADHAGNKVTRRLPSGILLFLNMAPILWYSKWQNTIETSTFGSEFVAMRIAVKLIEALQYKVQMLGVPIEGSTTVFCDNKEVTKNVIYPESILKNKKHNAIAYHRTREAVTAGMIRLTKEDGKTNLADVLTKLPQATKELLCDKFMY